MIDTYVRRFEMLSTFVDKTSTVNEPTACGTLATASDTLQGLIDTKIIQVVDRIWALTPEGVVALHSLYGAAKSCKHLDTDLERIGFAVPGFLCGLFAVDKELAARASDQKTKIDYPLPKEGDVYSKEETMHIVTNQYSWMCHLVRAVEDLDVDCQLASDNNEGLKLNNMSEVLYQTGRRLNGFPTLIARAAHIIEHNSTAIDRHITEIMQDEQFEDADYKMILVGCLCGIFA